MVTAAFHRVSTLLIALAIGGLAFGQNNRKSELEKQKIRLQDEIQLANRILRETKADEKATLGSIQTVERKLKLRENLLATLNSELKILDEETAQLEVDIDTLNAQLEREKKAYARMIQQAYKSKSTSSRLMFLLSSKTFNQALKRLEYMKQYAEFRRRQVALIEEKQNELNAKLEELQAQKVKKEAVKGQMINERQKLEQERSVQQESIEELKSKEKELAADIKEKQAKAKKIENEIQRIIAEEIRRAKERAIRKQIEEEAVRVGLSSGKDFTSRTSNEQLKKLIENKKKELRAANQKVDDSPAPEYDLTPEARKLAASFAANRHNLPWPVERGIVTSRFGKQNHPIARGVIINNNGIDIATERGAVARACFSGEVSVLRIPGGALAVIIRHGNYFTVYMNLQALQVSDGQTVSNGQELGTVFYNEAEGRSMLHFEVWLDNKPQDPMPWLAQK